MCAQYTAATPDYTFNPDMQKWCQANNCEVSKGKISQLTHCHTLSTMARMDKDSAAQDVGLTEAVHSLLVQMQKIVIVIVLGL